MFDSHDLLGGITKKVRADVSDFDRRLNPQAFLHWIATLERHFEWYYMAN